VAFSPDAEALTRFQTCTTLLLKKLGAPGITAAAVFADGSIVEAAAGLADIEKRTSMSAAHRMLGGSTGKSIFAATALSLAARGEIDLDAPVEQALGNEAWFHRLPNAADLTLRRLLHHASGLPDHMGKPGLMDDLHAIVRRDGPDGYLKPLDSVAMVLDMPAVAPAGETFFYADTNYFVAGLAIERLTGRDLYDLAAEHVLQPMKMTATEPSIARHFAQLAVPYAGGPAGGFSRQASEDGALLYSPRMEWAGGGFVTSSRDLALFIRAYGSGRWPSASHRDHVSDPVRFSWNPGHLAEYGLGLFLGRSSLGATVGHGGYYPGYRSFMTWFESHDMSVAIQVNASAPFDGYAAIVTDRVDAAAKKIDPAAPLSIVDDYVVELAAALLG
jgi:D-alanyl-D-alanine carboxypeptidase